MLWLWCRPAATTLIRPLAWETAYAMGAAKKKKRRRRRRRRRRKRRKRRKKNRKRKRKKKKKRKKRKKKKRRRRKKKKMTTLWVKCRGEKKTITEIKNSLEAANRRVQEAKKE